MIGIVKPYSFDTDCTLVINHDAIRAMEPFATILKRKRTSKGDADGRKKIINTMELKYIYFMADWDTYHSGLSSYERPIKAKRDCKLPSEWSVNTEVKEGIRIYKEVIDYYIPSARILIAMQKGLAMSANAIESYIIQMEIVIRNNAKRLEEGLTPEGAVLIMETNKIIQMNIKEILDIGTKLPKTLDGITSLQDKVRKEAGTAKKLQGDKIKRNREDPK